MSAPTRSEARAAFEALPRDVDRDTWWAAFYAWREASEAEAAQAAAAGWERLLLSLFADPSAHRVSVDTPITEGDPK